MKAETFEQLERYLREFNHFGSTGPCDYDFVGVFALFEAVLDNLSRYSLPTDLECLAETGDSAPILNRAQIRFLRALLERTESHARPSGTSA